MQKKVCSDALHRFPLFPGKYCYPVSPNTLGVVYKSNYFIIKTAILKEEMINSQWLFPQLENLLKI